MLLLIKNITLYSPGPIGNMDMLIGGEEILKISENIPSSDILSMGGRLVDGTGMIAVPGFVDGHTHLIGGGGEGGFSTRTPEGFAGQFIDVGTTTVVGMLGTDGVTRDHASLLAKVRDFNNKGLNAFMLTGSYRYPLKTLTGDVMKDIVLVPEIIGVGEVAVSDHRSSNITATELQRMAMDARVAGMLSGKSGVTVLHMGDALAGLKPLLEATDDGMLNPKQIIPTHIDRTEKLLAEGLNWVKERDGYIDFTADENRTAHILADLHSRGYNFERLCVSSDGLGSMPLFDAQKNLIGIRSGPVDTLRKTFVSLVKEHGLEIQRALMPFTSNPSRFYKLDSSGLGFIKEGKKASFLILNDELEIKGVFSMGRFLKEGGSLDDRNGCVL